MDGDRSARISELDELDLELLELLGTTGTETTAPQCMVVEQNAGAGFTWVGATTEGRRLVRRLVRLRAGEVTG